MSSLIRWSPLFEPMDLFDEVDKIFAGGFPAIKKGFGFMPAVDISQTDDAVIVEVSLPGIDPSEVNIRIENDVLTIDGEMKKEREVDEEKYYRKEMMRGKFHRALPLPSSVDGEKTKAVYKDGVLTVTVPKREEVKPKSVKISVEK